MKLVIATPLYPPEIGGPATYTKELQKGLPERGIEVAVVAFADVRHWPKFFRHYRYYRKILSAGQSADVILALDPVSVGFPAMKAARKLQKKFAVKIAGDYAWEQGTQRFGVTQSLDDFVRTPQSSLFVRKLQEIQTRVAQAADGVIVPSPYLKDVVMQWGISEEKIQVVYNGIELPASFPTPSRKGGEFLIVSAGRRVPWKGFESLERVVAKNPAWRLHIASGVSRAEVLGWMKAADVFVLNSRYEGFPHALIEAMTIGTPVVAADNRGTTSLITHKKTGLLVPWGDDAALYEALREVEQNLLAARTRAEEAKKQAEKFSLSRMLDTTASFLASL